MIITRIQRLRKRKPRYAIYIDGKQCLELSDTTIGKFGLRVDDSLDDSKLELIKKFDSEMEAKTYAINYISYRPRSSNEVLKYLRTKHFTKEVATSVIQHLQEVGLINDLEFARMFTRDRLKRKSIGESLLRQQLLSKGVSRSNIDCVIKEYITNSDQRKAAEEAARKRLNQMKRSFSKLEFMQRQKKLYDFLTRRGFNHDIAAQTVQSILRDKQ